MQFLSQSDVVTDSGSEVIILWKSMLAKFYSQDNLLQAVRCSGQTLGKRCHLIIKTLEYAPEIFDSFVLAIAVAPQWGTMVQKLKSLLLRVHNYDG